MWISMPLSILMAVVMVTEPLAEAATLAVEPRAAAVMPVAAELPELKAAERRELAIAEPPVTREPAAAIPAVKAVATTT